MEVQCLSSRIRAVTVYRSGASITRVASLGEGLALGGKLKLEGLPLALDDSSVSSRIVGPAGAGLVASDFQVILDVPGDDESLMPADSQQLRELRLRIEQLEARQRFIGEEIGYKLVLNDRPKSAPGEEPVPSPLKARLAFLDFVDTRLDTLYGQFHELGEELEAAREELEKLEAREREATTQRHARIGELRKAVIVSLQGQGAADSSLELEYFVPGACWAPSYTARLSSDLQQGSLSMRAMVAQRTGEDWSGVDLTLSTADLQGWAELPELSSKRIGRRQEQRPKRGWRAPPSGADELYRDYDNAFSGPGQGGSRAGKGRPQPRPPAQAEVFAGGAMMEDLEEAAPSFEDETTAIMDDSAMDLLKSSLGGAPPPAPMAAAPASYAADLEEVTQVSGRSEERRSSRAAPKRARKMRREQAPGGAVKEMAASFSAERGRSQELAPEPARVMNNELLQYGRLRMSRASEVRRGHLFVESVRGVYSEFFESSMMEMSYEVFDVLDAQLATAHSIAAMPSGHQRPWAEDYDYAFKAECQLDLVSDGQFHSVPVIAGESNCRPLHVVVPRESTDVFRTVKLDNPFAAPLLFGPIDVFWRDEFLLTSSVDFTPPKGELEMGLGVDQGIKVARNTHFREDTVGLMGGSIELTHKIVIEAANNGAHAIDLEVRERIPVAARDEEDVKVEIKNVAPAWSEWEQGVDDAGEQALRGGYCWRLRLEAGQQSELSASYEVKLPSKFELQGGNRREW